MSNRLKIVKDLNQELDVTVSKLEAVNKQVISISQSSRQSVGAFTNISAPKELEENTNAAEQAIKKLNEELKKQRDETIKLAAQLAKLKERRTRNKKATFEERVELAEIRKEYRLEVQSITELGTAYTRLSAQNSLLIRERNDLAVRQKTNNDLTEKEILRLNELTNTIQTNQQILSETDQEIGNFRRNVGNYSSAYDGLGNSINQITRELPAFTNSVQTGFLAISNNLPIFFDEIQRVIRQNKELQAQGKETQSVLKQLGKSFFTFQSLLSLGVVILTTYGKEIVSFIGSLFASEKQLDATTAAQEALNQAQIEGAKSAASQISETKLLFEVAQDVTRSTEEREKAVDELIESSEGLIDSTERQNILNGEALDSEEKLINSLIQRATLTAALALTGDNYSKILENQIKIQEKSNELIELGVLRGETQEEQEENLNKLIQLRSRRLKESTTRSIDRIAAETKGVKVLDDIIEATNDINNLQDKNNAILSEAAKIADSFTLGLNKSSKEQKDNIEAVKGSIKFLEQQISKLEEQRNKLATNSAEWAKYTDLIEKANVELAKLKFQLEGIDLQPVGDQIQSETQRIREAFKNITGELGADNIFEQETEILKDELDKQIEAREEAAKKQQEILKKSLKLQKDLRQEFTFSTIDAINDVFDAQIQRYDDQIEANANFFDRILENRELSEDQRESLERERDEREEELREKQRKEEQKAFLFNQALALAEIGLNLAKTITAINLAAAAQDAITPFAFGGTGAAFRAANIPFAIGVAAAQTASVLAQTIPAFEHGKNFRDNYEGLGIWGEKKREIKISKDGKMEMSPKKIGNHLTYVKKDDIIIPDADKYINSLSDDDLRSNLQRHIYNANISNQNYIADRAIKNQILSSKALENKIDTLTQVLESKKFRFNLNQDMSSAGKELGKQLRFQERKRNTL